MEDVAGTENTVWSLGPPEEVAALLVSDMRSSPASQRIMFHPRFNAIGCVVREDTPGTYRMVCIFADLNLHLW